MRDYREMLELGVRPSPHTYNSLYRSISAAAWSLREEGGGLPEEEDGILPKESDVVQS